MLILIGLLLFGLLFLGFPIMVVLIVTGLALMILYIPDVDLILFVQQLISSIESYILLAIPMFIFAADIICQGKTANRLLDFVKDLIGHIKGGTGIVTALASTLFGSVSGSTQATIAAIGSPMRNRAIQAGYKDSHIMGLIVNASGIAMLIPPSIVMIYFGMLTGTSVGELFVAGIFPGVLIFVAFSIYEYIIASKNRIPVEPRASMKQIWKSFQKASLTLGFPIIILGGIYSGIVSPTEAAAFSVLYAFILEVFVFRAVKIRDLYSIAASTGVVTGIVFILLAAGGAFSWIISYMRIPELLTDSILSGDPSSMYVLFIMSLFFLVACMFVDSLVAIAILAPIFFPLGVQLGIDPIVIGILITLQSTLGTVTPPFGVNIFTACAIFNQPYSKVIKGIVPYIIILLAISVVLVVFPDIILVYRLLF